MRRLFQLVLVLLAVSLVSHAGEVIDRIAATVNNTAILESDVDAALRCEALLGGRQLDKFNASDRNATLQRLIDQELLRQQMGNDVPEPKADEVAERLRQVRSQIPGADSDNGWHRRLAEYGVDESDLTQRISLQTRTERFLDQRLRPSIRVDQTSIQSYYKEQFLPKLKLPEGQHAPELREVRPQIQEILLQQRMDEEVTVWLRTLRDQGRVRIPSDLRPATPGPVESGR